MEARTTQDVCHCGHPRHYHARPDGATPMGGDGVGRCIGCGCERFMPVGGRRAMSGVLADKLAAAKSEAQAVLEAWPDEAYGFAGTLERAVALMGECVDELDRVGEDS